MFTLHDEEVHIGDRVFDVSSSRGVGTVNNINEMGIEVSFAKGPRVVYDTRGVQKGRSRATLFWHDPICVIPVRNEKDWDVQRQVAEVLQKKLRGIRNG